MPRLARARRWLAPMLALIGIVSSATPAAALLLWTLTATPLTATSGVATNFSLTATNLDLLTELGCLEVDLPESFDIVGASAGNASNGDSWEAVVFPNKVAVHSLSGGGRLELGQSITFVITAIPIQVGTWTWTNHAHRLQDCSGAEEIGEPLAVVVLPGLTPTPTPTPTPILPIDPLPTLPPIDPVPSLLPTLPPLRLPTPLPTTRPTESPTPSPSPTASPAENAAATPGGTSGSPPDSAPGATGGSNAELALSEPGGSEGAEGSRGGVGDVDLGPLGVIDGIGVWAIPGAIVGGPGLLVILWVLLQTGVALAWIPAVRRMRGKDSGRPAAFSGPRRTVAP